MDDSMRCLRRTWDQSKYPRLLKYSSLPELQLVVKERHPSRCCQCGVTNSLISATCLCCTSMPRARRASAPSSVFIQIDLSPSSGKFFLLADNQPNTDSNWSTASSKQSAMNAKPSLIDPPPTVPTISFHIPVQTLVSATAGHDGCTVSHRNYIHDTDTYVVNDYIRQRSSLPVPTRKGFGDVATATNSLSTSSPSSAQPHVTVERVEIYDPEENNSARAECLTHTADPDRTLTEKMSSGPFSPGGVDRSHSDPTTAPKPKVVSRGAFNVGCADKTPGFHLDDTHEHAKNVPLIHDETTSPPIKSAQSPKHQHFRPLRRKNHLNILPSNPGSDAPEPIAISLTLHHSPPPTSSHLSKKASQILTDYISPHPHTKTHSLPQSIVASVSSGTTDHVTPPTTPTHQRSLPSSPKIKSAGTTGRSSPESSPVRLGHPSRPYYNAIRKNGISPPPSRARPLSQPPPSSFHLGFGLTPDKATPESTASTSASRHASMSAMPSTFSAFALDNDGDDNGDDDNGDFEVHSGPTNSARLSLSSSLHRLSYNSHTQTHAHHTQSLSRANGINSNRSSGIGFSMSGETELRMALATSPSGVATLGRTTEDGFRFRETVIPSENVTMKTDYLHSQCRGSRDSFFGRVKKLRQGLKEILTNKNMMTARTATR